MKLFLTIVVVLQLVFIILIVAAEEDKISDLEYKLSVAKTALIIDKSLKFKEIND